MSRIKDGLITKKKRKKVLKLTKGFVGSHSKLFRTANQQMMRSLRYSYFDRKKKKNKNRGLWITRINAACKILRTKYSIVISLLKRFIMLLNRKTLSEIGGYNWTYFPRLIPNESSFNSKN